MDEISRYRQALSAIAELASAATQGSSESAPTAATNDLPGPDLGCTIKALPDRLAVPAAETAARVNPVNAPLLAAAATNLPGVLAPEHIVLFTSRYWGPDPREFTVSFMDPAEPELRARIVSHMNAWSATCGITFAETRGTGTVRISFGPGGYYSYLGTDILHIPQSQQTMNLEAFSMDLPESEYRRVVRHETGHTMGFPHEHLRRALVKLIDPAKAYPYFLATQGWDKRMVDAQVLTPLKKASIMGTPADQDSIMCYQLPGSITYNGQPIRGGTDIDATDAAFAASIYPKPSLAPGVPRQRSAQGEWAESEDVLEPAIP